MKIRFLLRKLSRIARFCSAKGHHTPNFVEKTFPYSRKTAKFTKVFSLKSFLLYSIILVMNETRSSPYVSLLLLQLSYIITNSRRGRERGFLMNYLLLSFFHHFLNLYTPAIIPIIAPIVATMPNTTIVVPTTIAIMLSVLSPPAWPVVPLVAAAYVCVQNTRFINFGTLILKQKPSHLT